MKDKPVVVIEGSSMGAVLIPPEGEKIYVGNVSDMLSRILELSGDYPGLLMDDRRGWKFPGEA